ncbi:MAG: hypothetical protein QXX94_07045 [Candidatus Bathyarchaeia archaeon]
MLSRIFMITLNRQDYPLLLCICLLSSLILTGISSEEIDFIAQSEENILLAFEKVREAEKAGANVSELIEELNEALTLLHEAKTCFINGDLEKAAEKVSRSNNIVDDVKAKAIFLKDSAYAQAKNSYMLSFLTFIIGAPSIILATIVVWKWFKRKEHKCKFNRGN